jgi:dipeptidyl-peptidase 4
MRKLFLSVVVCFALTSIQAQTKQLSTSQMLKNDRKGLTQDIPKISGWLDDTHYLTSKGRGEFNSIDINTGTTTTYIPPKPPIDVTVRNGDVVFISGTTEKVMTTTKEDEKNPTLSPDGTKIAFTRKNDMYVIDVASGKETRLTTDGTDLIYNGYASWVYYEEILGRATRYKAFWWGPDSKQIAYMHFNDTEVPLFPIYNSEGQHGFVENTRYPKAGDKNPEVKVGVVDITTAKTVWTDFNEKDDQYFGTPFWSDGKLWVQWMNRGQDHLVLYAVDPKTGKKASVYNEQQKTWVDWLDKMEVLKDNKGFIIQSDKTGWMHLYHYDLSGKLVNQITSGNWTVSNVEKIDEKKGIIYFTAKKESSTRTDLYSVKMNGKDITRLTFGDYTHSVSLNPSGTGFITSYSNVSTPTRIAYVDIANKSQKEIANSKGAELDQYQLAKTELIRVKTSDGFELPVLITWPLNYDKNQKYPLWISIYGGPNAGSVKDGWNNIGQNQWWAKEGLIQVAIDHRGSGHFGKAGQNYMHRNLGEWEIKDYGEVVKYLIANANVDPTRVGITGFSYGGYTTAMALTKGADIFTHGFAGGTVADWKLYDTHYTERFMDSPQENPEGYKSGSVWPYLKNYKGYMYIAHGTMDDNVHMQNSIQLISALQDLKKDFGFMLYPGGRHGWGNLPAKQQHFNNEKSKFIYQYMLQKPLNKEVLQ